MFDLTKMWTECLTLLEEEVSQVGYSTWIKNLTPLKVEDGVIIISAKTEIVRNMVKSRYSDLIKNTIAQITGRILDVEFVIHEESGEKPQEKKNEAKPSHSSFYDKFTFENFIVGNSNRFAQSASLAVAELPAHAYNPLFLHGGVGLGKTHLIHAIGNYIKKENPDSKILFISSEQFTNELINSIRDNKNQEFRDKYRNIDVLLIDDIQFIAGKTSTEEEFFHTFNALHESNKQIVITSDRSPEEMKTLPERLKGRFGWGLVCEILSPDYETRMAILRKKAQDENVIISDEIIDCIAQNVTSNIRELEGIFNRVIAYRSLLNKEITLDMVMGILSEYSKLNVNQITPENIIEACSKFYGVKKEEIYTKKKTKDVALARQVAAYIMKELLPEYSSSKIGSFLGRDHSTIIHSVKTVTQLINEDDAFRFNIEGLINDIKGSN